MNIYNKNGKKNHTFLLGTLALSLAAFSVKILGVIYKIPLSYILTDEGMGYFNTAYTIYGLFYVLCTAGVPKAVTLLIAEAKEDSNEQAERKILGISMRIFLVLGFLITLIYLLLSPIVSVFIGSKKSLATMLSIAPTIIFVSLSGVMRGYLNGRSSLIPIAVSQLIEAIIKLVLGLLFAYLGMKMNFSLPMISAFTMLGITLGSITSCIYLYICCYFGKKHEKTGQIINLSYKSIIKSIVKIALPISVGSSVISLAGLLDLSLIMRRLINIGISEMEAASLYGNYTTLAVPMQNLIISILTPISVAILPKLVSANTKGDIRTVETRLNNTLWITSFIAAPCCAAFLYYSFDILDLLFSSPSSAVGAPMLSYLSLGIYLMAALTVINTGNEGLKNIKITVVSLLVGCGVKVIVGYVLIGNESIGILGAPIGTVISNAVSLVISLYVLQKKVRIKVFSSIILPMLLSLISFGLPYLFVYLNGYLKDSVPMFLLLIASSFLIYGILCYFICAPREIKEIIIQNRQKRKVCKEKL